MKKQSLTEILDNQHFNQFAAILSVTMAPGWRMRHPEVPSIRGTVEYRLARLNRGMLKDAENIKRDFIGEWTDLFTQVVEADPGLRYSVEDMDWFVAVMDGDETTARLTFSLLFAVASTRTTWLTLDKIAEITGKPDSTLRRHASEGRYAGARLAGKTWIVPLLSLKAYYDIPGTMNIEVETSDEKEK